MASCGARQWPAQARRSRRSCGMATLPNSACQSKVQGAIPDHGPQLVPGGGGSWSCAAPHCKDSSCAEPHGVRGSDARSFPAASRGMKLEEARVALPFQERRAAPNRLLPALKRAASSWMAASTLEFAPREKVAEKKILRPRAQGVVRPAADHCTFRNG